MQHALINTKAGSRQRLLLSQLEKQGIITMNRETGYWERDGKCCKYAKDLLYNNDKSIDEMIADYEPYVTALEKAAEKNHTKLSGTARNKLNNLYEMKSFIENKY